MTRPSVADAAVAVLVAAVGYAITQGGLSGDTVGRDVDGFALSLVVGSALTLIVRRLWPGPVVLVTASATLAYLLATYPYGPIYFPLAVAVYTAARQLRRKPALIWSALALAALLPPVFVHPGAAYGPFGVMLASAWVAVPFAVGVSVRLTRESARRDREESLRQAVDAERLRIAQEVHDVVGHGLAAIKMQADVALHVLERKPEQAEEALHAISDTSTRALDEVRATLAVMRPAQQASQPGMADAPALVQRMTDAGLVIDSRIAELRKLPPDVDLAAYRVLQESLTNVLKHGARKQASVRVEQTEDAVVITVSNPADQESTMDGGLGIKGMSERVGALGGTLEAGRGQGGFAVHATIPTERTP